MTVKSESIILFCLEFSALIMDGFLQPGMAQTCSTMKATLDARIRSLQRLKHNPDVN